VWSVIIINVIDVVLTGCRCSDYKNKVLLKICKSFLKKNLCLASLYVTLTSGQNIVFTTFAKVVKNKKPEGERGNKKC
jgi:phosphatidate phosphatase APP1